MPQLSRNKQSARDKYKSGLFCCYCEKPLTLKTVTKEHLTPKSKGGRGSRYKSKNIKPCCFDCNHEKGSKTLIEYRNYLLYKPLTEDVYTVFTKIDNAQKLNGKCATT